MQTGTQILALLGLFYFALQGYRFLSFIWVYLLRPSSVKKYLHANVQPYALVTGATDGIGKAVAKQLYIRGFNLIIHGRNEEKTKQVVNEIKALGGQRDIRYFLADATKADHDFQTLLNPFKSLNITIVVNNVGGTPINRSKIDEWSSEEIMNTVRWNAIFPLHIIHSLLPQLRRAKGPALVINVGSYAGETPPPRLSLYASSKRFVDTLGWALSIDEEYYTPTNVDFMYLVVGEVSTNAVRKENTLLCPDADTFARSVIDRIGCGRRRIAPYIFHAMSHWFVESFGEFLRVKIVAEAMRQMYHDKKE
ncbi:hypothetical protein M422DRAFT_36001 [Sphaerobolus stellatus SS14]|uniref:Very-long-chain 3-oxoacyl-CoA reductase n=1 Tax=Sphaerobolus stellatus (strain SS14) TaxID=990650 RepID=A0A0C9UBP7_SPHS4|nr:hypothetical protein M422DRAFT_36001 [Sphaerobolus stellatus SS14]